MHRREENNKIEELKSKMMSLLKYIHPNMRTRSQYIHAYEENHEILSQALDVPVLRFASDETLENALLQYALFLNNNTCRKLSNQICIDGQATFSLNFQTREIYFVYQSFTFEQIRELVSILSQHYPDMPISIKYANNTTALRPLFPAIHFELALFYERIIIDMATNISFQNSFHRFLKNQDLINRFSPLWNNENRAEVNVRELFTFPQPQVRFFSSFLSKEEKEAKTFLEDIKDGSDLHVFSCLIEMKKTPHSPEIQDRITFALQKLSFLQSLYMRKITHLPTLLCEKIHAYMG